MSYKTKTIRTLIEDIDAKKVFLPALQRKFVWGRPQIQILFDSIMRNYPIGTFLFWRLHKEKAEEYVFYCFMQNYDARTPYNEKKIGAFLPEEITGVLDGQQRLSSMYVGLMGSHTEKAPYKHSWNSNAYQPMFLYLNLLSLPYFIGANDHIFEDDENNFEFRFLAEPDLDKTSRSKSNEAADASAQTAIDEQLFWFKVGDVLKWRIEDPDLEKYFEGFLGSCKTELQRASIINNKRLIIKCLNVLHHRLNSQELISYFEVTKEDLEDILKIFVRVNSGGTVLNKSDLLFSTIVATWDNGRDKIETLLKSINDKGDKFNFGHEYLMRCCLVLTDAPVVYKVNSFKPENVQKIRDEWENVAKAISSAVDLLVEYGFSGNLLTSQNATIIIAYYLYKGGNTDKESKKNIRKYLIHALLNNIYSSSQDQLISKLRDNFRVSDPMAVGAPKYIKKYDKFPFDELLKLDLPGRKSLTVSETDVDQFLMYRKGPAAFFVLTLLYPSLRYEQVQFHLDHIHPAAHFIDQEFKKMSIPSDQWKIWRDLRDRVPNLQLLEGRQNQSKNATALVDWLEDGLMDHEKSSFQASNFFPADVDSQFKNFIQFFDGRKTLLKGELMKLLAISNNLPSEQIDPPMQEENEDEMLSLVNSDDNEIE